MQLQYEKTTAMQKLRQVTAIYRTCWACRNSLNVVFVQNFICSETEIPSL